MEWPAILSNHKRRVFGHFTLFCKETQWDIFVPTFFFFLTLWHILVSITAVVCSNSWSLCFVSCFNSIFILNYFSFLDCLGSFWNYSYMYFYWLLPQTFAQMTSYTFWNKGVQDFFVFYTSERVCWTRAGPWTAGVVKLFLFRCLVLHFDLAFFKCTICVICTQGLLL